MQNNPRNFCVVEKWIRLLLRSIEHELFLDYCPPIVGFWKEKFLRIFRRLLLNFLSDYWLRFEKLIILRSP